MVPAAGASVRFRGYPKACLPVGEEPAVRRIARLALEARCTPVVVVAGPHEHEIRRVLEGSPVRIVPNPRWALGRTGSIQVGLEHVPEGDDVLLWPVDHPFVEDMSLDALARARRRDALALWFIPMYLGQGGHPVLLRSPVLDAIRALGPDEPLRTLHPRFGPQIARVPVSDPGVVANVDSPDEYRYHEQHWRSRWTGG